MSTAFWRLEGIYAQLKNRPSNLKRQKLEALCDAAAADLRLILQTLNQNPDGPWVTEVPVVPNPFPELLYVNEEEERNGDKFLLCQERGLDGLPSGTPLGRYRLEGTARVKVTVEAVEVSRG